MREILLNQDWTFQRLGGAGDDANVVGEPLEGGMWEDVTLPHTARIEPAEVRFPWQGICWYRRDVIANPEWRGQRVSLVFGAAMQIADVWVNGRHRTRHLGGYLPFTVDITDDLRYSEPNIIAVRLDNRDTDQCPPGKPTADLDFCYSGGLYRDVRLVITNPVHISDPVAAGIEAGGGVFVTYHDVSAERATVRIKTHVLNDGAEPARRCVVESRIVDQKGAVVAAHCSQPLMIAPGQGHHFTQEVVVERPLLWHPNHPYLYALESAVVVEVLGEEAPANPSDENQIDRLSLRVDALSTRIGIRRVEIGKRLRINGKVFKIRGTNRHQEYPFLGNAVSPAAQRRDAVKIKEGGFNFVRLAHYPQHPAFLDACDELGILVQAAIPGWQIFHANSSFVANSFDNIRDLIRRDRNHASVIFWEPNLNEVWGDHTDWCRAAYEIAHAEYPGDQCFTFGDDYPADWTGWDIKGLVREYGDWSFGGNESTSRQRRGDGESAMLQQAWNFQWTLNHLSSAFDDPDAVHLGGANWLMFDHNRGYYHKPNYCGAMDAFRLPKFVYDFYRSQADPEIVRPEYASGPMVAIASFWTPSPHAPIMGSPNDASPVGPEAQKVVVYSNCDEVALWLNGRLITRQRPDSGPDTSYGGDRDLNLATVGHDVETSGGKPFDGGNARHLEHPPFTFFDVPGEPGVLDAVGYRNGRESARDSVRTPGQPAALRVFVDTSGVDLVADGADAVFVHAQIVDAEGTVVHSACVPVRFRTTGPGRLLCPDSDGHGSGTVCALAEGGIASALLQAAREPGDIVITAEAAGLDVVSVTITSQARPDCPDARSAV